MKTAAIDGRKTRWEDHRAQRREELIELVIGAVREHGAGVGMDQIAAAAGTSKAVFYRYFEDKDDIYRLVGRKLATDLVAGVGRAVDAETDDRTMLAAGVRAYLKLLDEETELYRFVVHNRAAASGMADGAAGESDGDFGDYTGLVSDLITSVFQARLTEMGHSPEPANPWGVAVVGAVRAAGDWWLDHRGLSREQLGDYLVALLWHGMAGAHTEPAAVSNGRRRKASK